MCSLLVAVAGCGAPTASGSGTEGATSPATAHPSSGASQSGSSTSPSASPTSSGAVGALTPPTGPSWTPSPAGSSVQVAHTSGVTLMWMDPTRVRFRYVAGTQFPEHSPASRADRTPATWVPTMVAAFNSGYKLRDHVGGFYYLGRTVSPLRSGLAAFTVRADGSLHVGVWGRDLSMTPDTVVVRENLRPLIEQGVVRASPSDTPRTWGIANGNTVHANRSALGSLPDGSFVFAMGHDVTALQLASALAGVRVVDAVMLDMNKSWPTGFVYSHNGSRTTGARIDPHVVRDPSTYFQPFKKDFVVVRLA